MQPYLCVVWQNPTDKEKEDGGTPRFIGELIRVMAESAEKAKMHAYAQAVTKYGESERLEVGVIPFSN